MNVKDAVTQVRAALVGGELDLPMPGRGATTERWVTLRAWGHRDLVLARFVESHAEAVAVLVEAGRDVEPDLLHAVWIRTDGETALKAERLSDGRLRVEGRIGQAAGARFVDRALVTARSEEGVHLVELALPDPSVVPVDGTWTPVGLVATKSLDVDVRTTDLPLSAEIGAPGWYDERPGRAIAGIDAAAVWCGGAAGALDDLCGVLGLTGDSRPHQLAHVGAAAAALWAADAAVWSAAAEVDLDPAGDHTALALAVRHVAEQAALEVVARSGRALGSEPLVHDPRHARRIADLELSVRQVGAENDLERLGTDVVQAPGRWVR